MKKIVFLLSFVLFFGLVSNARAGTTVTINGQTVYDSETTSNVTVTGEHIKDFGSQIAINADGTIRVKESIVYDFGDLQRHGIFRTIPTIKTNRENKKFQLGIRNVSVEDESGKAYQYTVTNDSDALTIKIGDPNKTISGVHQYVITYTVAGALTYFSDHDELYWNCTGNDWTVPIVKSTCQVTLPVGISPNEIKKSCYSGYKGSTASQCETEANSNNVITTSKNPLSASEGLTIVVGFPKNIAAVLEPKEVIPFGQTLWGKLVSLGIVLLALFWYIVYPIKIIFKWFLHGRDPRGSVGEVTAWFDPPKSPKTDRFLTPGEVGTLGDETADTKDVSATIVDLARRGYFRIEERKKGDFYFVKTAEFSDDPRLLLFEQKLLKGMFGGKKSIRLKDEDLYQTVEDAKKNLYQQTVDDGLFAENPQSIRNFYSGIAVFALMTGNIVLAFIAFVFGRNLPRKTVDGVNAFHVGKSLKNFLSSQERQLTFQAKNQMMFERLLPYAIVFGVETVWAKRFNDIDMKPPDWYQGYETTNFNSVILASSLHSSLNSFSSAARPPTTTTSSSGFSSGFSGGFSGGGGGGGGGGSW